MRDVHPFLVLSPRNFNNTTSLAIGLPMTTAEYNADNPFAVPHRAGQRSNQGRKNQLRTLPPAKIIRLACARCDGASAQEVAGFALR